jgi:hypothetical protein
LQVFDREKSIGETQESVADEGTVKEEKSIGRAQKSEVDKGTVKEKSIGWTQKHEANRLGND